MKTKILLYGSLLTIVATLTGCDDILDKDPLDRFTNNSTFWNNPSDVEGECASFYEQFTGYGNGTGSGLYYFKTLSDDQASNSFKDWDYTNVPASDNSWKNTYTEIRRANTVITRAGGSSMATADKNKWVGVGRLMRAWEYYQLVRMYGDVQWTNSVLDVVDTDVLYGTRANRDVVMDSVLQDLNYACATIPANSSKIQWSKNMALAMKSEICLWEGTYRKYRSTADGQSAPDETGAKKFLTASAEASNELITNGGYTLNDDYHGNYNSTSLLSNSEMIFVKYYKVTVLMHSLIDYTSTSTMISGLSKDAFDAYLFTDGKPLATTTMDKNDAGYVDANGNVNISKLLAVRDKRLAATTDSIVYYKGNTWARVGTDGLGMQMTSSTGYGVQKYDNATLPWAYRGFGNANYTNAPVFWLSVIYLNYAEAKAELGTITSEDLVNTIDKLNTRAGIPALSLTPEADPANNMGVSNLIWEIRRARRCELIMDNWTRYWDLVRWHQLDKLDSSKYPNILLGANLKNVTGTLEVTTNDVNGGKYINATFGKTRTYNNKYYFYPIPSGQITLNPNLTQNPGWQ